MLKHLNPKPGAAVHRREHPATSCRTSSSSGPRTASTRSACSTTGCRTSTSAAATSSCTGQGGRPEDQEFLKRKIQAAQWLIDAIEQRRNTLEKVTRAIIKHQRAFLDKGPEHIEPLKMQQIADQVGVHVTTVSRAVDDKWVQTPRGIFPLKRFFGGGTQTATGEEVAWETIKQKLLEIIGNEDKSNPLSDEDLVNKLAGGRLPGRPADGDQVPQDAQHPVVAAAQGLDAADVDSRACRSSSRLATLKHAGRDLAGAIACLGCRHSAAMSLRDTCSTTCAAGRAASARAAAPKAIDRQHEKGRLTARERIAKLIDPGTTFFELGLWAGVEHVRATGAAPRRPASSPASARSPAGGS